MQVVRMNAKDLCGLGVIISGAIKSVQYEPTLGLFDGLVVLGQLNSCDWLPLQ